VPADERRLLIHGGLTDKPSRNASGMAGCLGNSCRGSPPWKVSARFEPLRSPCQNLDFREGRNLGEFGRTPIGKGGSDR
jgi:hypothetical protein